MFYILSHTYILIAIFAVLVVNFLKAGRCSKEEDSEIYYSDGEARGFNLFASHRLAQLKCWQNTMNTRNPITVLNR